MPYRVLLPVPPGESGRARRLDLVDGGSTAVQRQVRRVGLGGYETPTMATLLAAAAADSDLVFFDVGANMGLYGALVATLFRPRSVVAFEPTPSTASIARQVVASNRLAVTVEEVALGSVDGRAELFLSAKSDASNSLVEGFKSSTGTIGVPVRTLDGYATEQGLAPSLLKIDVETFEPQVIEGARQTLTMHRPTIVAEVLNRRGHDHGVELTAAMSGLGYHYHHIDEALELEERPVIAGVKGTPHHDWLLTPEPLDDELRAAARSWRAALERCGPETHPRLPVLATVRAVARSEGWGAVARAVKNRARRSLRPVR